MSLSIRVLFFSYAAERMNGREQEMLCEPGTRVADLLEQWRPQLGAPERFMFAVNQVWAAPDQVLCAGDVLAVIPPVAGG